MDVQPDSPSDSPAQSEAAGVFRWLVYLLTGALLSGGPLAAQALRAPTRPYGSFDDAGCAAFACIATLLGILAVRGLQTGNVYAIRLSGLVPNGSFGRKKEPFAFFLCIVLYGGAAVLLYASYLYMLLI